MLTYPLLDANEQSSPDIPGNSERSFLQSNYVSRAENKWVYTRE